MQRYRATKISIPDDARFPTADNIDEYRAHLFEREGFSPPLEYYVEGLPFSWNGHALPKVGQSFCLARDNRNGVKADGIFQTSTVVAVSETVGHTLFTTRNSIYKLEPVE